MGKKCLKCSYERTQNDVAPEYECPKCGAIYEKVEASNRRKKAPTKNEKRYTKNTEANEQVNVIAELVKGGKTNEEIANHLQSEKYRNLRTNEISWNSGDVDQIRKSFNLFINRKPKNSKIDESKKNTIIKTTDKRPINLGTGGNKSLIRCPDCGKDVSRRAEKCPNCGAPIRKKTHGVFSGCLWLSLILLVMPFVVILLFSDKTTNQRVRSAEKTINLDIINSEYADPGDVYDAKRLLREMPAEFCSGSWGEANPTGAVSVHMRCDNGGKIVNGLIKIRDGRIEKIY